MTKFVAILGGAIVIIGIIATSSLFIVEQTQQAIVLFFGKTAENHRRARPQLQDSVSPKRSSTTKNGSLISIRQPSA